MPHHVHMLVHSAKVRGVAGGGVHQGQERHPSGEGVCRRKRNFVGQHFWARGYFVSTVGRDEAVIREQSVSRKRRTSDWISLVCGDKPPPERWRQPEGPR